MRLSPREGQDVADDAASLAKPLSIAATSVSIALGLALFAYQLGSLVPLRASYAGWWRPLAILAVAGGLGWMVSRAIGALSAAPADGVLAAVGGCLVLFVTFAFGVRKSGFLVDTDLAVVDFVRRRFS